MYILYSQYLNCELNNIINSVPKIHYSVHSNSDAQRLLNSLYQDWIKNYKSNDKYLFNNIDEASNYIKENYQLYQQIEENNKNFILIKISPDMYCSLKYNIIINKGWVYNSYDVEFTPFMSFGISNIIERGLFTNNTPSPINNIDLLEQINKLKKPKLIIKHKKRVFTEKESFLDELKNKLLKRRKTIN